MTEEQWLATKHAYPPLFHLRNTGASDRKFRLFACGVARRLWDRIVHDDIRRAVEVAERAADGLAQRAGLQPACDVAFRAVRGRQGVRAGWAAANSAYPDAHHAALASATQGGMTGLRQAGVIAVLREVFGNPFRPVAVSPPWRTDTVAALAQAAYEERPLPACLLDAPRLAVLADALEDAGCDNGDLLSHLRSPGPHVRGCWALDLVLGKS